MNSGTSCRNELTPMGCEAYKSVQTANLLVSRLATEQNNFICVQWKLCFSKFPFTKSLQGGWGESAGCP